jgi:hypothetical protein
VSPSPYFLWIVDVARADTVDDLGRGVAEQAFGADVEQLDDAALVGGNDREIGARQDGVLQRPGFEQRALQRRVGRPVRCYGAVATRFEHG